MKIKVDTDHYLMVETEATYQSVHLFKNGEKMPIASGNFGLDYTRKDLKKWGETQIKSTIEAMKQQVGEILERFNEDDVLDALVLHGGEYFIDAIKDRLKCDGCIVVEPKTIRENDAIIEAINTVYPYHNEQNKIYQLNII